MEWIIVTVGDGGDAAPLATLLNEGWNISRADATRYTIVYVLYKRLPPGVGMAIGGHSALTGITPATSAPQQL